MHREPHGIGEGLIMGGKSLLMVSIRLKLFKLFLHFVLTIFTISLDTQAFTCNLVFDFNSLQGLFFGVSGVVVKPVEGMEEMSTHPNTI